MSKYEDEDMELIKTVAENNHHNAVKPFERGAMPKGQMINTKLVETGMLLERIDKMAEVYNLLFDRLNIHNGSEGLAPVSLQEESPRVNCSRFDHVKLEFLVMAIQGQGMFRQGLSGGPTQQGQPILGAILQLMEQMTRMNSHVDESQDFVKTNVQAMTNNKKAKQVPFSDQLPSQAMANPMNQGGSSCQTHNLNHVHIVEEAVETTLAISSLRSGKDLPDSYKDHPTHQGPIDEETPIIVEHDSDSEDEEEQTKGEPNPDTYKSPVPYPQALNHPKAKISEIDDYLLEAFKKVTITIPLIDAIKHIPSYAKFLKGICTPHRNRRRIQLSEMVSSIMMNSLPIKKRDPGAPMITSEIGGMSFTRSLLDTGASINILPKSVFNHHHVGELQPFLVELCLADGSVRKPHSIVEDVIIKIEDCCFVIDFLVVDMKTTKELSQAPIIFG